jgi:glutathione S-transferase
VLCDTDLPEPNTLPDSSAISDYLEHKFPNPALYPADPFQRARAIFYEEYADTILAQTVGPGVFFERIVKKMLRQQPDESAVAAVLKDKIPPLFDFLENEIRAKEFFAGDMFSIADISMGTMFVNFEHAGETVDYARWPNLSHYVAAIHARPSFKALIEEERPICDRMRAA